MGQNRSKHRILLITLLLLSVITACLAYFLTTPIDITSYSDTIASRIEAKTKARFSAKKIVIRVLPSFRLSLEEVELFEGTERFLYLQQATATFPIFKLLSGTPKPKTIDLVEPDILIKRYSNGSPNLGALFIANIRPKGTLTDMRLRNGRSTIIDETIESAEQRFELTEVDFTFEKRPDAELVSSFTAKLDSTPIQLTSTGRYEHKRLRFNGPVTVGTFDLTRLNPYIQQNAPKGEITGTASARLTFAFDRGLTIDGVLHYNELSVKAPRLFNERIASRSGSAKLHFGVDSNEIIAGLDGVMFKMAGFDLSGGMEVSKPLHAGAKERKLKLKIATTPIPLKKFKALLPSNLLTGKLAEKMGGIKPLGGTITVEELSVDGRMNSLQNMGKLAKEGKVGLRLRLNNLKFTGRVLKETFSGVKGLISLEQDRLNLSEFSGNYGHGVLEEMNAEVTELTTEPKYAVSVKAFFEAGKTLEILKAIYGKKGELAARRLKWIKVSGITGLDLKLIGNFKDLNPTGYSGNIRLKNASFGHKGFLLKLSELNGEIAFDTERLVLKNLNGEGWESTFNLNGTIQRYQKKNPYLDIKVEAELARETLVAIAGDNRLEPLSFGSKVPLKVAIKGNTALLNSRASVDFTGTNLKYGPLIDKSAGYPFALEADLIKVENESVSEIKIKDFNIRTGSSRAGVTGVYNLRTKSYTVTAATHDLQVTDIARLTPSFDSSLTAAGSVGFSFKASKEGKETKPLYRGVATVKNATFSSNYIPSPVERLNLSAEYGPDSIRLDIKEFVAGRTDLKGIIELKHALPAGVKKSAENISNRTTRLWDTDFNLDAAGFFLSDLLYPREENDNGSTKDDIEALKKRGSLPLLKSLGSGKGSISIKHGAIRGLTFEDLSTEILIDPKKISAAEVLLRKNRGHVTSSITYYRTKEAPLLFESTTKISHIDLKQFIDELGANKTIIEGELSADLKLNGLQGTTPVSAGLTGSAQMRVGQGKLWKFLVMSKIFSILNIFSIDELLQQGLPYKRITGDFDIKEGIVRSNNIYLESDTLRMTAMGEISIPDQYIDSVLLLHPFVTIDKIVTMIPLAGWIIGGKEKSAASMYYEIVGPLKKPYIDPVPEKSISTGVKEMMERLGKELELKSDKRKK